MLLTGLPSQLTIVKTKNTEVSMKPLKWIGIVLVFAVIIGCLSPELRTTRIAVNEKDWNRALRSADMEIARNPASAEAYYWKGYIYEKLGDYPKMSEEFDKSLEVSSQFSDKIKEVRLRLLAKYDKKYIEAYNNKEWETALMALDTAIIIDPGFSELYKRAMMVAYYGELYDRAVHFAKIAIEREKDGKKDIPIRRALLVIAQEQGNHEQTIQWAKELMTLVDPGDDKDEIYITSIGAMVGAYEAMGDHEASEKVIADAIKTFPKDVELKMNLAYFMIEKEDFEGAANIYREILALDPGNVIANLNLGKIRFNQKEYSETIKLLEKVLQFEKNNTEAMKILASAYFNTEQDAKGHEMVKKLKEAMTKEGE